MNSRYLFATLAVAAIPVLAAPALADRDDDDRRSGRFLSRMDSDKDGVISRDEFLRRHADLFARLDSDKSGGLSVAEMAAFSPRKHGGWGDDGSEDKDDRDEKEDKDAMSDSPAQPSEAMQAMRQAMAEQHFRGLDADGNGTVTKSEFSAMPEMRFAVLDADGNGSLSTEEMRQAKRIWRDHHPGLPKRDDDRRD
jgi:Ca2+-binding EF-hand superfamily protein